MKKLYLILALCISFPVFAAKSSVRLEGIYECMGNEIGTNAAFTCQMTLKKTNETYSSVAECADGNIYRGTGIYDKNTHSLAGVFINPKKSEETGVSISKVKNDGSIISEWTYLDKTLIGYTRCLKKIFKK